MGKLIIFLISNYKLTEPIMYINSHFIKDEVLITVGCPIFRSIDNLETQKNYISMKNSQFFNYLFYAKSK